MTARNAITNIRGALSYKACFLYVLISGATLFFTFLAYSTHYAPIVWSGNCAPSEPGKETARVTCDAAGHKVSDSLSLKLMYRVMKDNKPLICNVDALNNIDCKAGE